ncbi:MAG: ABC transporter substrate-binding protein [Methylobacteriaceae bacterium]|nr:ABC transporter substrate-binding protein [Methylobacteriaceae bacterium]
MLARRLFLAAAALAIAATAACAGETIRVGVIGPFSGPFNLAGKNFKAGVDTYFALNGSKVGDDSLDVIYRDLPTPDPAKAKSLAQELIVKDKVQYLAGIYFTPDALAVAPLLEEANVPLVIFNAATSAITTKSPLIVRTSFTLWQTSATMAKVAAQRGIKKVVTAVTDYGPGVDAETAFKKTFEAAGGTVVETIRMPLSTNDFNPVMQRIKDAGAPALFAFLPAGPPSLGFAKAFNENGLKQAGVQFLTTGDVTDESNLPALGDAALGVLSTYHYSIAHDSDANRKFVEAATKAIGGPDQLTFPAVAAYDGMYVITKMVAATGGKQDAQKAVDAVKGLAWESPRGPVTLDPQTRTLDETIYLRIVDKVDGRYINKEIASFPNTPDYGLLQNK